MDVYFEAQQGFGSELHIRPLYGAGRGVGLASGFSGGALGLVLRTTHKRWPGLCCQSSSCLDRCARVEASQISSNFRSTSQGLDLQGRQFLVQTDMSLFTWTWIFLVIFHFHLLPLIRSVFLVHYLYPVLWSTFYLTWRPLNIMFNIQIHAYFQIFFLF